MKSSNLWKSALLGLVLPVMASCQTIPTTGQIAQSIETQTAKKVCKTFPQLSYNSVKDTEITTDQVRRFNAARAAFCKGVEP